MGLALQVVSMIGARGEKPDTLGQVGWPSKTPFEEKMIEYQAGVMSNLRQEVNDPEIMQAIYTNIPDGNMSAEAQTRFDSEFAEINQQVTSIFLENANTLYGAKIDDLEQQGYMTPEMADSEKVKTEASIMAVTQMHKNKMDVVNSELAMDYHKKEQGSGLKTAQALTNVRQTNQNLLTRALRNAADYRFREEKGEAGLIDELASRGSDYDLSNQRTQNNLYTTIAEEFGTTLAEEFGTASADKIEKS